MRCAATVGPAPVRAAASSQLGDVRSRLISAQTHPAIGETDRRDKGWGRTPNGDVSLTRLSLFSIHSIITSRDQDR